MGSLALALICSVLCWWLHHCAEHRLWAAWLLALSFFPLFPLLQSGQIGKTWASTGVCGFLYAVQHERWQLAGAFTVLISLKPQLLLLFWFALLVWVIRYGRWGVIAGAATSVLAASALPLLFNIRLPLSLPVRDATRPTACLDAPDNRHCIAASPRRGSILAAVRTSRRLCCGLSSIGDGGAGAGIGLSDSLCYCS